MRGPCCSVFYHIPFNASSETALYEHFSLYRHYCIHSTVNHSNSSSPFLSPWNTARSSRFSINDWSNQWEHVNTPIHLAFFFSFLYIINALFHKINNNTASCKHISVSLRNTRALNNPSTSGKEKMLSPRNRLSANFAASLCLFLLTPTLYLHAIFTQDMDLYHTDKKMPASGIWFLCFLLDLCLINISRPLKDLLQKVVFDDKWMPCKQEMWDM